MSFLVKNPSLRKICYTRILGTTNSRQSHWLPDFIPGPRPETKEKREEAARKYNLLPEEYKPYDINNECPGDYPELPYESVDSKDPYYPWDFKEIRKDYKEPIHREIISLLPGKISTLPDSYITTKGLIYFLALTSSAFLFYYICQLAKRVRIVSEKQFPTPGVTHYTFDLMPDNSDPLQKQKLEACLKEAGFPDPSNVTF